MNRRAFSVGLGSLGALLVFSRFSWAGSYLERAALLLHGSEVEAKRMRRRFHDKELARVLHSLAETRVRAAGDMQVPEEVKRAHPHLLLSLERYERALHAATNGDHTAFLLALDKARREETTFRAIIEKSGWTLPTV